MLDRLATNAVEWAVSHPELAASIGTLLTGGAEAARRYRRSGSLPSALAQLPWKAIRRLGYAARRHLGSYPKPSAEALATINANLATVEQRLGTQSYEPGWPFSYHYEGEDLNARRYYYDGEREYPHRQLHIRGWEMDGAVAIDAHEEPSTIQHTRVHIQSTDMHDATEWAAQRLEDGNANGLDPRGFPTKSESSSASGPEAEST
jgi:hypothetical protein